MSNELKMVYQTKIEALLPLINASDKKEIVSARIVSRPTLDAYLTGNIIKIEVAQSIIEFLTNRVNERISKYKDCAA